MNEYAFNLASVVLLSGWEVIRIENWIEELGSISGYVFYTSVFQISIIYFPINVHQIEGPRDTNCRELLNDISPYGRAEYIFYVISEDIFLKDKNSESWVFLNMRNANQR